MDRDGKVLSCESRVSNYSRFSGADWLKTDDDGHRAEHRAFGGFCYFNNAALAAQELCSQGKVAIIDIDYHHGNGTQNIFYHRSDVLTISLHGHPRFKCQTILPGALDRKIWPLSARHQVIGFWLKRRSRILTFSRARRRGSMAVSPPDPIPASGFFPARALKIRNMSATTHASRVTFFPSRRSSTQVGAISNRCPLR
ncbi:MAG: hypothetical protein K0A94_00965 [Desulfuromonadales bacterium]|nr:hypothetical protein [Desulfuromonadales bacterium]